MAPSAKRRKRNIVSDDEEPPKSQTNTLANYLFPSPDSKKTETSDAYRAPSLSPSPVRKSSRISVSQSSKPATIPTKPSQSKSRNGIRNKGLNRLASVSPGKSKTRPTGQTKSEEKSKSADLLTLFSKQAERAPVKLPSKLDEPISDPISDDDDVGEHRAAATSRVGQIARVRFREPPQSGKDANVVSSQKFLRPPKPSRGPTSDEEHRPWSERFCPVNLEELAVHKRKVADVRRWLEDVIAGRMRQRLLILKGAAGTGKTTTVRLLAKDMRCELLEWRNPVGSLGAAHGFQSASAQFEEFMGRGGKFGQLDLGLGEEIPATNPGSQANDMRKIILIEEFPNTFTRASTALMSFRNTILTFLATNTPSLSMFGRSQPSETIMPVIMVISETLLTTTSASADSFTAHRLLGPEITRHPGTCIIEFNAIAPTLLAGALELVVQKEARKSGRRKTPGPLVLRRLGEIGDIRSAISSLEFMCLKGDQEADWSSRISFTKPKRSLKSSTSMTKAETETLELVSQREASLGIFHAVGKVVYNKREETPMNRDTPGGRAEQLPDFLAHCSRPKRAEVSVDSLIDETGTDTPTFISALHENYILSCESTDASDSSSSLDYINGCIEYLSESDLLCPSRDIFFGGRASGSLGFARESPSHVLRQEEMTFQVATRGLLFSLPNPVKRISTMARRGGGDAFKMFYPTSLKLWREKEELEGLIDRWASTLMKGDEPAHNLTDGASIFRRPKSTNPGDWLSRKSTQQNRPDVTKPEHTENSAVPLLSLGSSARREMLLERLPYMAHMARRRRQLGRLKEFEKIVSFTGVGGTTDEDAAAAEGAEMSELGLVEAWATDRPTEEASPRKKAGFGMRHSETTGLQQATQKLVLSDDDIEDD